MSAAAGSVVPRPPGASIDSSAPRAAASVAARRRARALERVSVRGIHLGPDPRRAPAPAPAPAASSSPSPPERDPPPPRESLDAPEDPSPAHRARVSRVDAHELRGDGQGGGGERGRDVLRERLAERRERGVQVLARDRGGDGGAALVLDPHLQRRRDEA